MCYLYSIFRTVYDIYKAYSRHCVIFIEYMPDTMRYLYMLCIIYIYRKNVCIYRYIYIYTHIDIHIYIYCYEQRPELGENRPALLAGRSDSPSFRQCSEALSLYRG